MAAAGATERKPHGSPPSVASRHYVLMLVRRVRCVGAAAGPTVKFKVVYCSSVDDGVDPDVLSQNVPNGTGWCSQRYVNSQGLAWLACD